MTRRTSAQDAAKTLLTTLLTEALIDMRATAYSGAHVVEVEGFTDLERIRVLADMFHNVPGEMQEAADGAGDFQEVLDRLWQRNPDFGHAWLEGVLRRGGIERDSDLLTAWR
jgi:hypothetical protein